MDPTRRIITLIDMDCFYVQVERRRDPSIRGKPCAVVQYNKWKGGGIIAVSYEAREKGVTRQMRGDDAKKACPDIILCKVPTAHEKADLTRYRDACAEVIQVFLQFGGVLERASIDEAYIDLTSIIDRKLSNKGAATLVPQLNQLSNTHVIGKPSDTSNASDIVDSRLAGVEEYLNSSGSDCNVIRLATAAALVEEIRAAVFQQTSFHCSAGISHNKMLAKLACGIHKPNKQTILPYDEVAGLFSTIKIGKIRNLGGKLGSSLQRIYGIEKIGQLTQVSSQTLLNEYGEKTGNWLHDVCRGIDHEPVKERHVAQSVGCSKNFRGADALDTRAKVRKWLESLATELVERLLVDKERNNRIATNLTAHVGYQSRKAVSRVCTFDKYDVQQVLKYTLQTLEQLNEFQDDQSDKWVPAITMMGLYARNFKDIAGNDNSRNPGNIVSLLQKSPKQFKLKTENTAVISPPRKKKRQSIESFLLPSPTTNNHELRTDTNMTGPTIQSHSDVRNLNLVVDRNKSITPKKLLDKNMSFFGHLQKKKTDCPPMCKIDQAFLRNTDQKNIEKQNNLPTIKPESSKFELTTNNLQNEVEHQYEMENIDLQVLNALPLYLQQEIIRNSRKEVKNVSPKSNSISKYMSKCEPSFSVGKPIATKHSVQSGSVKSAEKKHFPLGFFRARTQASNAIHLALTQKSQQSSKNKDFQTI